MTLRGLLWLFVLLTFVWLSAGLSGCIDTNCVPGCAPGYVCQFGQCLIDSEGGRQQVIRCEDYCVKLQSCGKSANLEGCKSVNCFTRTDATEQAFYTKLYECYMASTCEDIRTYLDTYDGSLRTCAGCFRDTDCPGGLRCDMANGICLNRCSTNSECRDNSECDTNTGRCRGTSP